MRRRVTHDTRRTRADTSAPAVVFDGVVKRFGPTRALDGASFEVARGETVALLGPNGAGKSTSVGVLLGLLGADGGRASVLDQTPAAAVTSGRVGAMLQSAGLPPGATVGEVVDLIRRLYPEPLPLRDVLAAASLTDLVGRKVDGLSGGQAQRVRFALAVAGDPELLFLDEPTVAMDVESRRSFWSTMRESAAAGRSIVFATHYLEEAEAVADRIVVLAGGRVVADGPASTIKAMAGSRRVAFTLAGADPVRLSALPEVTDVSVHGTGVTLRSNRPERTLAAVWAAGLDIGDLEVTAAGLEDAFLALTSGSGPADTGPTRAALHPPAVSAQPRPASPAATDRS